MHIDLFTDGSVHPPSKIGYGACLIVPAPDSDPAGLKDAVQLKRFENTSSARLEIETLLWALQELKPGKITIYSDSQTIIELPDRRSRIEANQYCSAHGRPLNHADLYRTFFQLIDQFDCTFIKVKGHSRSRDKSRIEQLFTLVDRASRSALRAELAQS